MSLCTSASARWRRSFAAETWSHEKQVGILDLLHELEVKNDDLVAENARLTAQAQLDSDSHQLALEKKDLLVQQALAEIRSLEEEVEARDLELKRLAEQQQQQQQQQQQPWAAPYGQHNFAPPPPPPQQQQQPWAAPYGQQQQQQQPQQQRYFGFGVQQQQPRQSAWSSPPPQQPYHFKRRTPPQQQEQQYQQQAWSPPPSTPPRPSAPAPYDSPD
jgi:hypothetical protein